MNDGHAQRPVSPIQIMTHWHRDRVAFQRTSCGRSVPDGQEETHAEQHSDGAERAVAREIPAVRFNRLSTRTMIHGIGIAKGVGWGPVALESCERLDRLAVRPLYTAGEQRGGDDKDQTEDAAGGLRVHTGSTHNVVGRR